MSSIFCGGGEEGMPADPNAAALEVLRRELTPGARSALAHLLNNAVAPVVCEVSFPDAEVRLGELREAVRTLARRVREVLR